MLCVVISPVEILGYEYRGGKPHPWDLSQALDLPVDLAQNILDQSK
jgi:hypothetical protein